MGNSSLQSLWIQQYVCITVYGGMVTQKDGNELYSAHYFLFLNKNYHYQFLFYLELSAFAKKIIVIPDLII
jgi:hypothetical protein